MGEHLLDVLAGAGIAAYLQPSADVHPVTRVNFLPSRPTDRLFVDRTRVDTAREHVGRLIPPGAEPGGAEPDAADSATAGTPAVGSTVTATGSRGPGPAAGRDTGTGPDFDAVWASIVASYHSEPTGTDPDGTGQTGGGTAGGRGGTGGTAGGRGGTGGTAGDGYPGDGTGWGRYRDATAEPAGPGGPPRRPDRPAGPQPEEEHPPSLLDALDTFGAGLDGDDDDSYHPPPPPPVPRPSWYTIVAVLGVLAGLAVLIFPDALPVSPDSALLLGLAGLVTGFGILVWRLRPGGADDDQERHPDDGAVV